ncbi:tetratricopeptide repeat protein [Nostoc parmelioides]|uniref:Tetratricopeptide repeat protein n=1 Tax=Nostoc parmelioides FACHB-3921 TaxID=2692909 RepID=A0ABR8BJA4_9NOSO|nr:tetratricopeptide repeat protein [Nostoc parmelioides FACHB-3921]
MLLNIGVNQKAIANTSSQNISPVIVSQVQTTADPLVELGITRQELEKALAESDEAIKLNPNDVDAYLDRAMIRHFSKDYAGAISDYEQAIKLRPRPKDVSVYSNSGKAHAELGDHTGAIAKYNTALTIDPNGVFSLFIYNDRGLSYLALGDTKSAIADFNQAIQLAPESADSYYNRGLAQRRLGQKQAAIADFQKAAKFYQANNKTEEYKRTLKQLEELQ